MKKNTLFSLDVYEFECDHAMVDEVLEQIITLDKDKKIYWNINPALPEVQSFNGYLSADQSKCFYNKKLLDWITECFNKVSEEKYKHKLVVVDSWVSKTSFLAGCGWHDHTMSILSGVLYFGDSSPLELLFNDPYHQDTVVFRHPMFLNANKMFTKIFPTKGKFIVFPSHIAHRIHPNKHKADRYSLAFNTFFSGELSKIPTTRLSITSKEIE